MAKSYYAILGISSMANADEIRTAYRRLAKTYHPDRYSGSSDTFREVQEAYDVLGNTERRRQYERRFRKRPGPRSMGRPDGRTAPEPLVPGDAPSAAMDEIRPMRPSPTMPPTYDTVFDWMWRNYSRLRPPRFDQVRTTTLEAAITPEQARQGGTVTIMVPARAHCPICSGYGSIGVYECSRCAGEGVITGDMPVAIAVPPGIKDDDRMVLPLNRYGARDLQLTLIFRIVTPVGP